MDIISPDLVWFEGACHRINDLQEIRNVVEPQYEEASNAYIEQDDEEDDDDIEYITTNNGRIKTSFHVPLCYFGYIIGKKGITLKRIMNETRTEIKLPPRGVKGDIVINGPDIKAVGKATRRIKMIISDARRRQDLTHFIGIPLISNEIITNVKKFKEDILSNDRSNGIEESIFIIPTKLHITLYVLSLMDNNERIMAINLLNEAKTLIIDPILKGKQIEICLKGVSYMNDDPKCTDVLYAEITEKNESDRGILKNMVEQLREFFAKNGFDSVRNRPNVKLHVTLMNTRKRLGEEENSKNRTPFDATNILKNFKDFNFGEDILKEMHIFQMNSGESEHYSSTASIKL